MVFSSLTFLFMFLSMVSIIYFLPEENIEKETFVSALW